MSLPLVLSLSAFAVSTFSVILMIRLRAGLVAQADWSITRAEFNDFLSAQAEKATGVTDRLQTLEKSKVDQAAWISQTENHNLKRQGQIVRLHRRGQSASEIASALKVGKGEVKLTIKVHELCRHASPGTRDK